ncbi:DUF6969 family protein [Pseudomonadota bacterium]
MSVFQKFSELISGQKELATPVDIEGVENAQLRRSYLAGLKIEEILEGLSKEGKSVVDVVLNNKPFVKWEMYPWEGGILDQRNSSQYFYHSHTGYKNEHGHFHSFYYYQRKLAHLIAIGITKKGQINKLYTFNRWSPGDHYFPAKRLKSFLPRFNVGSRNRLDARLHQLINNVHVLFQPEIEWLFDARDETFRQYREAHDGQSPYEDRSLEITSELSIDLRVKLAQLREELTRRSEGIPELINLNHEEADKQVPSEIDTLVPIEKLDDEVPHVDLDQCYQAGMVLQELKKKFRQDQTNVVACVMNDQPLEEWEVYPWEDGIIDNKNKSQYFYHSHPQSPEHGHFHIFKRHANKLVHLIAIAMDDNAEPIELFTVNTWVTGEKVLPVQKIKRFVRAFKIASNNFDQRVGEFVVQVIKLYGAEIERLIDEREKVYAVYRTEHGGSDPYEDRTLEVTSTLKINIDQKLQKLENAIARQQDRSVA